MKHTGTTKQPVKINSTKSLKIRILVVHDVAYRNNKASKENKQYIEPSNKNTHST